MVVLISVFGLVSTAFVILSGGGFVAALRPEMAAVGSAQDLETNSSFFDAYSVYSYGKVASNRTGAAAIFWNAHSARELVARTWQNGVLNPLTDQPPLVLFSGSAAGGGIISSNLALNISTNLDVFSRNDRVYLAFITGDSSQPNPPLYVGLTWANISTLASIADYTAWHSANGHVPPSRGSASNGNGIDILPENSSAASVVATRDGRIVVAAQETPGLYLDILYFNGASWSKRTIFGSGLVGEPHLAIDDQDDLHLTFSVASFTNPNVMYAVLYATCLLGSQGADPSIAANWKGASGSAAFDPVIARSGVALYSRSYLTVYGTEVRTAGLSSDKATFYFNVLRNGLWAGGTGTVQSGWVIPSATSQARYPYTFYQWSQDALGNSYLFYEHANTLYSTMWNGTTWASPASIGGSSYVNVIGQTQGRVPGMPLLIFSRDSVANKLVLFPVPTRANGPDTEGPIVSPSSLMMTPTAFVSPAVAQVNATIDDRPTGGSMIAAAELFLDTIGAAGSGIPMAAVAPGSFGSSNLTSVTWVGQVNLPTGSYRAWVHGKDDAGNWGSFANVSFQVLPRSGPTSSLVLAWFGWSSDGTAEVGYQAAAPAGLASVSLYSAYSSDNATFGSWVPSGVQSATGSSFSGSFAFVAADGPGWYRFLTNATDLLGQSESLAGKVPSRMGYDASTPTGVVAVGSVWFTAGNVILDLTATDDVSLKQASLFLTNSTDNRSFGAWFIAATWSLGGTAWTTRWSAGLPDDFWRSALVVTDASGREFNSDRSYTQTFGVDTHSPDSRITSALPVYPTGAWSVGYLARDNLGLVKAELRVSRSTDNLTWSPWADEGNATLVGKESSGSFTVASAMEEGWVRLAVLAVDVAGWRSAETDANEGIVPVDQVAPALTIMNLTQGMWYAPSHQVVIESSENATIDYRFDLNPSWTPAGLEGAVPFAGLSDGVHVLDVEARDRAGNLGNATATIHVDGTPPELAWCSVPYILANGSLMLCWTAADGLSGVSRIVVSLDGQPNLVPLNATGWSTNVGAGNHTVLLQATDRAGNVATRTLKIPSSQMGLSPEILLLIAPLILAVVVLAVAVAWGWRPSRHNRR